MTTSNPFEPSTEEHLGYESGFLYKSAEGEDLAKLLDIYYQHANMSFRKAWERGYGDALKQETTS